MLVRSKRRLAMRLGSVCAAASQPFRWGHPETLSEDPRQSRGIGISNGGCDELQRVALAQHRLGDSQAPVRQVIKWRHSDDLAKVGGEARARHACGLRQLLERPGGFRVFVHALDRLTQTFIGEPQQDTTLDQV